MRSIIQAGCFALALGIDASRLLSIPGLDAGPLLFVALTVWFSMRAGPLGGGAWGFSGGLALGLLYADSSLGARVLGGLLAGSVPVSLRRLLFWRRWPGQVALGALAALLFDLTLLIAGLARGNLVGRPGSLLPGLALDASLTGVACPLLVRLMSRLERAG